MACRDGNDAARVPRVVKMSVVPLGLGGLRSFGHVLIMGFDALKCFYVSFELGVLFNGFDVHDVDI